MLCVRAVLLNGFVYLSIATILLMPQAYAASADEALSNKASLQAQRLFESIRPSVLKVQTIPLGSDTPYSYGTGFAVGTNNLIVTNYHVVSSVVIDPDRYQLEFIRQDGGKGALSIVAIDVVNDLAIVKGDTGLISGLEIDESIPNKGTRGFSIGFPENQGITVTEGIINGLSEDSVSGAIHYSGPINSGMSGGPAVNSFGKVFGVNVSSLRNSQMISFVVPSRFVAPLVAKAQKYGIRTSKDLFSDLNLQLLQNSKVILGLFPEDSLPVQRFGQFLAPAKPGDFARCYAANDKESDKLYSADIAGCRFKDMTYVTDNLNVGSWMVNYRHVKSAKLGALRFASLIESMMEGDDDTSATNRLHKSAWSCQTRLVTSTGTRLKSVLCLRRYTRFEGLYDIQLKMATIDVVGESLVTDLTLTGFAYPESMALTKRFMESVIWKP